ncbi:MAG: adenylosuccinate lyase [Coriobacteriia bacterium]|nr:adenylosuccinate lyase [Coriobacteriia bacterium]
MIDRYSRPEMAHIWTLQNKYEVWREIEVLACEAQAQLGDIGITAKEAALIHLRADFSVERIAELEVTLRHDVIAFLTNLAENIGEESKWVHYGMTSSDLGDTALCYLLTQAVDILLEDVVRVGEICKRRAFETRDMLCVGRTHGVHAEPMTFGMKFARWAYAMNRAQKRLLAAREMIAVGAISGAVGSYSSIDPFVEEYVCKKLGLKPDPLSTQIVARDRHAQLLSVLATVAASAEDIATEIRAMQKTEMLEAEEPFTSGQKGSSAMPHKRNPIISERICGLARVVKANAQVGFDNVALWHERDISHSSAERVVLADSTLALDYLLNKLAWVLDGLVLYPQRMQTNLNVTRGLIYSSHILLAMIDAGMTREAAYEVVQRAAMQVWEDVQTAQAGSTLADLLAADDVCPLSAGQLAKICQPEQFLTRVDTVFARLESLTF